MRPHRLSVTAFGPFAGTVEVDLDTLAGTGVFLLHGETGAGKTTLLDAVGFALYGRVPGERSKARRLRSDFAEAGTRTSVQLEITLAGRRLRITRSPEQSRPKQRGSGVTVEPARMLLEESTPAGWTVRSTRIDEASKEIVEHLGMSAEQFFQVVLLPQNDFARFLRANSEERGGLLERLFGTDRFGRAEAWLAEQRRLSAAAVTRAEADVDVLRARLAQAAGVEPDAGARPAPTSDPAAAAMADLAWPSRLLATAKTAARAGRADVIARQAAADQAQAAAAEVRLAGDRQQRRRAALLRQQTLQAAAPAMDLLVTELAAGHRAAEVATRIAECDAREAELDRACRHADAALRRLPELAGDPMGGLRAVRAALQRWRIRAGRLDGLRTVADAAALDRATAAQAAREAEHLSWTLARCNAALDELPAERAAREAAAGAARAAELRLPVESGRADALRIAHTDALRLLEARSAIGDTDRALLAARRLMLDLRQQAVALRESRVDGMIAELAAALTDDAPCPVCGSLDHPDPSEVRGAAVTRQQEEAAYGAAEESGQQVAALAEQLASQRTTAEALAARLAEAGHPSADPDHLAESLRNQEQLLARLRTAAAGVVAAETSLDDLEQLTARLTAEGVALAEQVRACTDSARAAQLRADGAEQKIAEQLDGAADLPGARGAAARAIELLEGADTALEALERAKAEAARAAAAACRAADSAGFPDVPAARSALREDAWRAQTGTMLERHAAERAAIEGILADRDLDIALEPAADVPAAEAALQASLDALGEAQRRHSVALQRADAVAELCPRILDGLQRLEPLRSRATELRHLADLVNGSGANALRMTLTSFVLAARLEEVAAAASERLLRMTEGRYALLHTDAGRGGARTGLGLLIQDAWTGLDRDTGTLSGGETFLASLALALGLADVVTAEVGGSPVEALFIDEGFGTLDESTLDEVMDVLDGLRQGGRMVGLVSHVAELQQRVPSQVLVTKGRTGSSLAVLGGGTATADEGLLASAAGR